MGIVRGRHGSGHATWQGSGTRLGVGLLLVSALSLAGCATTGIESIRGGAESIAFARSLPANARPRIAVGPILDHSGLGPLSLYAQGLLLARRPGYKGEAPTPTSTTAAVRDLLSTELFNSGAFIVLERGDDLNDVLAEQAFAAGPLADPRLALPAGQLEGAQYLLLGAITSFDAGLSGWSIPVPIPLGGRDFTSGIALANISSQKGEVTLDLRLVDVATGRVVKTLAVEGTNRSYGLGLSGIVSGRHGAAVIPPGLIGAYARTPVEKALQDMATKAVEALAAATVPTSAMPVSAPATDTPVGTVSPAAPDAAPGPMPDGGADH